MTNKIHLTYLEFYSGIGGWSYALEEAIGQIHHPQQEQQHQRHSSLEITLERLAAFDHSDLCNHVLQYNQHPSSNNFSFKTNVSIEHLTEKYLADLSAKIWVMSPPCQPHTRQHNNQKEDLNDPRSQSFLHLCHMLSVLDESKLPKLVLLENVIGFEESHSFSIFRKSLRERKYKMTHFHLSPTQIGVPNDRPRHYTIAVLPSEAYILNMANYSYMQWLDSIAFDVYKDAPIIQNTMPSFMVDNQDISIKTLHVYLDPKNDHRHDLLVPEKLMSRNSSWCFDIVTSSDSRSACFTSSYGRFVRGTGSVLYTGTSNIEPFKLVSPDERKFDSHWADGIKLSGHLRYFAGYEIARLFGFPVKDRNTIKVVGNTETVHTNRNIFEFPPDCTEKQQWKLLGNSINVHVAAKMVSIGLCIMLNGWHDTTNKQV